MPLTDDISSCFMDDETTRYKLKAEEPEKPKYKLLRIKWDNEYPVVHSELRKMDCTVDLLGQRIDGYRVFGFTDNPKWATITRAMEAEGGSPHYKTEPCDHLGTRKYAIGRIEA